jgi:hypothetical protein
MAALSGLFIGDSMDRQTEYAGQILPETVLLQIAKDSMIGLAKLSSAMFGTSNIANGFAVTPTGPASLQVVVAPGEIYSLTSIDATAYSSLPADTTHSIMKQGILLDGLTLTCAAPSTTGQSINYLIEVTYQDVDSTPVLLPYYNSANPALPFNGMGNNGLTQNTSRKGVAVIQVKPGASATTGSQVTPAPDAGFSGLYVVTVAYGQTTITSASISVYASAPLLPSGIVQSIQSGASSFAVDTGVANAYVCNFYPALVARSESQPLRFKVKTTNTGASTFNDGLGAVALVGGAQAALQGGELVANGDAWVQWNSSIGAGAYILLFCTGAPEQVAPATQSQQAVQQSQLGNYNGVAFTSSSQALTTAFLGKTLVVNTGGTTQTLPPSAGLLSGSAVTIVVWGATTLKGNAAELISNPAGVSANTLVVNAGEQVTLTVTSGGWYVSSYSQAPVGAPVGSMRNAKIYIPTASATATYTADEVVVETALGGQTYRLFSANDSINLASATKGIGAMDTGSAPVGGYVALYKMFNPVTLATGLMAVNATSAKAPEVYGGASLPAGYTASALVSVLPTNASGQFSSCFMLDRTVGIASINLVITSTAPSAYTLLSIATAAPINAKSITLNMNATSTTVGSLISMVVAADANGLGLVLSGFTVSSASLGTSSFASVSVLTAQTLYWKATNSTGTPSLNLSTASYTF